MKVEYINPFINSTIETFKTMLRVELKPGKPQLKRDPNLTYDVSGVIGLTGDAIGNIIISFPTVVALRAVSKFMNLKIKTMGPEIVDAIGELANIIAGNAKQYLADMNLSISLPTVVVGKNHKINIPKDAMSICVPFSSEIGNITIEVNLKTK